MKKLSYLSVAGCAVLPLAMLGALAGPQSSQAESLAPVTPSSSSGILGGLLSTGAGVDGLLISLTGLLGSSSPAAPQLPVTTVPPVNSSPVTSVPVVTVPVAAAPVAVSAPLAAGSAMLRASKSANKVSVSTSTVAVVTATALGSEDANAQSLSTVVAPATTSTKPGPKVAAEGFTLASLWGPGAGVDGKSGILTLATMALLAIGMVARFRFLRLKTLRLTRAIRATHTD